MINLKDIFYSMSYQMSKGILAILMISLILLVFFGITISGYELFEIIIFPWKKAKCNDKTYNRYKNLQIVSGIIALIALVVTVVSVFITMLCSFGMIEKTQLIVNVFYDNGIFIMLGCAALAICSAIIEFGSGAKCIEIEEQKDAKGINIERNRD